MVILRYCSIQFAPLIPVINHLYICGASPAEILPDRHTNHIEDIQQSRRCHAQTLYNNTTVYTSGDGEIPCPVSDTNVHIIFMKLYQIQTRYYASAP